MAKGNVLFFLGLAAIVGVVIFLNLKPGSSTVQDRDETITDSKVERLMFKQGNENLPAPNNSKRYQNKEVRLIEYNSDSLPVRIEITRDYTIG